MRWTWGFLGTALWLVGCGGGDDGPDAGAAAAYLYVANSDDGSVSGYSIGESGRLLQVPGSPFAAPSLGFTLAYADPGRIFVPTGLADGNGIHSFVIDWETGALLAASGSPFPASRPDGSYGVVASPSGSHLFVNEPDVGGTVASYAISGSGALTEVDGSPFAVDGSLARSDITPSGQYLYVAGAQRNRVFGFRVDGGGLTPVPQVSVVTGPDTGDFSANPQHVAVHPAGNRLYVANFGAGTVAGFSIDTATGDLTEIAGSPFATAISTCAIAFDRQGRYLYAGIGGQDNTVNHLHAFAIDAGSGALTPVAGSPFDVGGSRICGIVPHPDADILYLVDGGAGTSGTVHVMAVNPETGAVGETSADPARPGAATLVFAVQPGG